MSLINMHKHITRTWCLGSEHLEEGCFNILFGIWEWEPIIQLPSDLVGDCVQHYLCIGCVLSCVQILI
jgi:hypothetical protein